MKSSIFFWHDWPKDYRYMWNVLLILFSLVIVLMWVFYFNGAKNVIHWEKIQEQKVVESTIHTFETGPFQLDVPGESYVIFEYFNGGNLTPNLFAYYSFLLLVVTAAIVLLAVITTLQGFWYFLGIGLFILFGVSLRLDVLAIFGQVNYWPTGILVGVLLLFSFYFSIARPSTPFILRIAAFTATIVGAAIIIHLFSEVSYPMLHLAVTAYPAAMVLTILFILLVSHEIIAGFITALSSGASANSLRHFTIISAIYIVNLIIACLHELGTIQWDFVYINLYLLLTISAIVAIWGLRQREVLYANILPYTPFGAFMFISLGIIAIGTTGFLLGAANDSALKVIRDLIIFSHLGYGLIFIIYVFSNFGGVMYQNMSASKILYKPTRMPYFTFQFAGLITVLAFVFYSNWREYVYHSLSGFYNNLGDLDIKIENRAFAEAHYDMSRSYGFRNHHANYALGKMKSRTFDLDGAERNYSLANGKRPTEFSMVNYGNILLWQDAVFQAINSYQLGINTFPDSGPVKNNLGYAYAKIHNVDSAVYYFNQARQDEVTKQTAEANFFALSTVEYLPLKADSVLNTFNTDYTATVANAIALSTTEGQSFETGIDPLASAELDLYSATLLNNYIINNIKRLDTTFLNRTFRIVSDSVNADYSEALKVTLASAFYHQHNVSKALNIMAEMAFISQMYQGRHNYIMGLWALEQQNPVLASTYFNYAVSQDYKEAKLYRAISLAEAGEITEARIAWDTVALSDDEQQKAMAERMRKILDATFQQALTFPEPEKYQFIHYRLDIADTTFFNTIINTLQDPNYKALALLDMSKKQFDWDNLEKAIVYFNMISGLKLTDRSLYEEIQHFELLLLAERRQTYELAQQINKDVTFDHSRLLDKIYYTALIAEANGDTTTAKMNYSILGSYNPYFEEGIIAAGKYFRDNDKDSMKSYNILVEAIQVNNNSIKLLKAYAAEAMRLGFDEYTVSTLERIEELRSRVQ